MTGQESNRVVLEDNLHEESRNLIRRLYRQNLEVHPCDYHTKINWCRCSFMTSVHNHNVGRDGSRQNSTTKKYSTVEVEVKVASTILLTQITRFFIKTTFHPKRYFKLKTRQGRPGPTTGLAKPECSMSRVYAITPNGDYYET